MCGSDRGGAGAESSEATEGLEGRRANVVDLLVDLVRLLLVLALLLKQILAAFLRDENPCDLGEVHDRFDDCHHRHAQKETHVAADVACRFCLSGDSLRSCVMVVVTASLYSAWDMSRKKTLIVARFSLSSLPLPLPLLDVFLRELVVDVPLQPLLRSLGESLRV